MRIERDGFRKHACLHPCKHAQISVSLPHDIGLAVNRPDHGWWGAQLVEPYVTERVTWAIRYHQALRYFADSSIGYEYPEMYVQMFGKDYKPAAYQEALAHRWYLTAPINLDPFMEIIARHFKQPAEGLGNDNRPTARMWRTIIDPGKLL